MEYPDLIVNLTNLFSHLQWPLRGNAAKGAGAPLFPGVIPQQVFTREQLLDHIWGYEYIGDTRTVDVHINRLRRSSACKTTIQTVYKVGYRLNSAN